MACPILSQLESRGASGNSRSSRPLVFAHRGGSKIGPENTIAAFDRGLAAGADGLELDVHLSRDGVVVVHHDPMLDRTTRATGPLKDRTAAELAELDVPTLRDVLARYPKTGIIVELKEPGPELAGAVVDEVRRAARDRTRLPGIVQRDGAASRARARRPRLRRAALDSKCGWRCIDRGSSVARPRARIRRFRFPKPAAPRASCRRAS